MNIQYFKHADDDTMMEQWRTANGNTPLAISDLHLDNFETDCYQTFEADNPQTALVHYLKDSDILALGSGESPKQNIWCRCNDHVWLFAVISASANWEGDTYTFDVRCHYDHEFVSQSMASKGCDSQPMED